MKRRAKLIPLLLSIAVLALAKEPAAFRPRPIESYPNAQTLEGVTLAAEAFDTAEKTRQAFGKVNPNRYGILPVLVLIKNGSTETLNLAEIRVEYIRPDRRRLEPIPPEEVPHYRGPEKPQIGPTVPYPIPGLGGRGRKNPLEALEIQARAFSARMLPAGDSAFGFFYFHTASHSGAVLYVSGIKKAKSGQPLFYFELPLGSAAGSQH